MTSTTKIANHKIGDRVMRPVRNKRDLRIIEGWKRGEVVEIKPRIRGVGSFIPADELVILWDGQSVPDRNHSQGDPGHCVGGSNDNEVSMLRLSLEVPTTKLKEWSPLLDLDFVLAHKVLADPEYARFFADRPLTREVILDNSTHEFGKPLPYTELERAANIVHPNILIAPDIVTPDMSQEQYDLNVQWMCECYDNLPFKHTDMQMAVVLCGQTPLDRSNYIYQAYGRADIMCFTFHDPRRLEWFHEFSHHPLFHYWERMHVLGMSSLDELRCWVDLSEKFSNINFSFDTCKPLKWGVQGKKLNEMTDVRGSMIKSKEVLEMKTFTKEQEALILENIEFLKKVCRGEA